MTKTSQVSGQKLGDVLAQIQRLEARRTALFEQRTRAQEEEQKVLADAYARKLQAAGLSIRQGIVALRPYEKAMRSSGQGASKSSSQGVQRMFTSQLARLQARARTVFGDDADQWLDRPHPLLGGISPREAARHPEELEKIEALLGA